VSTNVGGLPYLIDDGRDGLLVPQDDPEAMADAVLRILDEPELAARLSRGARQKAERLDWSPIIGEWRSLYAATAKAAA
jgi:glycosyltransferase involved in cell wall biosynthesis